MSSYYIILLLLNHSFFCTYSMTIYCRSIVHVILLFEIDHWTVSVTFLAKEEPSHCNPVVRHQHQRVNGKRPHFLFRRFVLWGGVRVVGSIPLCAVTFRCNGTFIWSSTFCCDWNRIVPVRPHTGGRGLKKRVSFSCTVMTKNRIVIPCDYKYTFSWPWLSLELEYMCLRFFKGVPWRTPNVVLLWVISICRPSAWSGLPSEGKLS